MQRSEQAHAPETAADDVHERETLPAPEPVIARLCNKRIDETPLVVRTLPPEALGGPSFDTDDTRPYRLAELPPEILDAVEAPGSSLAPAERLRRPETSGSPVTTAMLLVAAIAPLGVSAMWLAVARQHAHGRETVVGATARPRAAAAIAVPRTRPLGPAVVGSDDAPTGLLGSSTPADDEPTTEPAPDPLPRMHKSSSAVDPERPETPSRDDVVAALEPLRDAVQTCAQGRVGVAEVDISVRSSGAIAQVIVGGDFAGSSQGSCIARTLRRAHFRPFAQPRFRVLYPFQL
jgi:hypothetical protein